jgi:hypothetical protein
MRGDEGTTNPLGAGARACVRERPADEVAAGVGASRMELVDGYRADRFRSRHAM